jgi:SAM-dependent methyltransferase
VIRADVLRRPVGGRIRLWQPATGRGADFEPDSVAALDQGDAPEPLERRARDLGFVGDPTVTWVARRPEAVLLPDIPAIWAPDPERPGPGGPAYCAIPTDEVGVAVFRALDEPRRLEDLARSTGRTPDEVWAATAAWRQQDVQLLAGFDRRPRAMPPLLGPERPPSPRTPDQRDADGVTSLTAYHLTDVGPADRQFDDRETTVAHSLAVPHPILGGQAYGARLRDRLRPRDGAVVVEVGCGTGELAAAFSRGLRATYLRVDLSPALLRDQARAAPGTHGALGDATRLPLRGACVDVLVSNEVLADLAAAPTDPEPATCRAARDRYGLPAHGGAYNVGAWAFVAEIARVLRPGGVAWLSEFGDVDADPEEAVQLDHPEVSIRFDDVAQVARAHGLRATLHPLAEWLGADASARHLSRGSWWAVRARAAVGGWRLPARAWTPETLASALPERIEGLVWVPATDPGPGPLITRFWCLLLERPEFS